MKYLFTGRRFGLLKRGGYTIPKRLCESFPEYAEFIESDRLSLNQLKNYKKVIFWTQVPSSYKIPVNGISLRKFNTLVYIRDEHNNSLINSCTNGFHYYKEHPGIKNFIPLITPFNVEKRDRDIPCLGFYIRNDITRDSFDWFRNLVVNIKTDVDILLMGNPSTFDFKQMSKYVRYVTSTNDNESFFANVTHYIYPRSKLWVDPFPHTMLEAVQSGCQIISPMIHGRNHKDGVDDMLDCIKYHDDFNMDIYLDNSDTVLNYKYFVGFYKMLFDNDFEYQIDRDKYNRFNELIEREII